MFYIQQKSLQTLFLTELCLQAEARMAGLFASSCFFANLFVRKLLLWVKNTG
jgi:hypothetical protein